MSTNNGVIETDVLIVGSGPAGLTTAVGLASMKVNHIVITKYQWTANTPRAHITNQASMEIFRDYGIECNRRCHRPTICRTSVCGCSRVGSFVRDSQCPDAR